MPSTEIVRSPAAGLWLINSTRTRQAGLEVENGKSNARTIFRLVLKYPVEDMVMDTGDVTVGLNESLDPAGDSVTLSGANAAYLGAALQSGKSVRFVGRSRDTRRTVADVILPPDKKDIQACETFENDRLLREQMGHESSEGSWNSGAQSDDLALRGGLEFFDNLNAKWESLVFDSSATYFPHHGPIRVFWDVRLPGEPKKSELIGCRMTDLGGEIERYRLTQVDGFVSHSGEVWVTRDAQSQIRQVYIPGIFEALRAQGTNLWSADVSIAAFANEPFEAPVFKGCLGSHRFTMAPAPYVLSEPFDAFHTNFAGDEVTVANAGRFSTPTADAFLSLFDLDHDSSEIGSGSFLDDGWKEVDPRFQLTLSPGTQDPGISPVPLPPSLLLFLSGLGLFGLLRRKF